MWSMHGSRVGRSLGNKAAKARKFLLSGNGERFRAVHPHVIKVHAQSASVV